MKVYELIEQLKTAPQDCEVFLYIDGERYATTDTDASFTDVGFIDINAKIEGVTS
jgi:hypothetical protein